ncbi:MAG: hypothetical protein ACI9DO_002961, partial [Reinekea sp.]
TGLGRGEYVPVRLRSPSMAHIPVANPPATSAEFGA